MSYQRDGPRPPASTSSPCEMLKRLGKLDEADEFGNEWMSLLS